MSTPRASKGVNKLFLIATLFLLGYVALRNQGVSAYILSLYVACTFSAWMLSRSQPVVAAAAIVASITPYLMFLSMDRQVDAIYYEYIAKSFSYEDLASLIMSSYQDFLLGESESGLAKGSFILFVYPFVAGDVSYYELSFVPFNYLVVTLCAVVLFQLAGDFADNHGFGRQKRAIEAGAATVFLLSPSTLFFSNDLLKDQTSMLFVLLTGLLFVRKRYLLMAVSLIIAILLRRYNPLLIACVVLAVRIPSRRDYYYAGAFTLLMFVIVRGNIAAIANMILSIGYVYVNPLPFRADNWRMPTALVTIQGLLFGVALICAVWQVISRRWRAMGLDRLALSIALVGFVAIGVGYNNTVNLRDQQYEIGRGGDNMTRKSFPALPLIALQLALSAVLLRIPANRLTKAYAPSVSSRTMY